MVDFSSAAYRNTTSSISFSIPIQRMYNRISFHTNHSSNSLTITGYNYDNSYVQATTTTSTKVLNLTNNCNYINFSGTMASGEAYYSLYNE